MTVDKPIPIRSYVLRQSRISPAQQRAYQTLLPIYGIPYQGKPLDLDSVFQRSAPKILEIGFGMGETTAQIVQSMPEKDFLTIDVHTPGVGALLKQIDERSLSNIRIVQHDAIEVVRDMIMPNSLSGIHIFFPDPWPKKRHHKRRLLQPAFIALLALRLKPEGYLHIVTDWQDYAEQILSVLSTQPSLLNTAEAYASRPAYRPLTKFEQRGLQAGRPSWELIFKHCSTPTL